MLGKISGSFLLILLIFVVAACGEINEAGPENAKADSTSVVDNQDDNTTQTPPPPPVEEPPQNLPPPPPQKVTEQITIFNNGNMEISELMPMGEVPFMLVEGKITKIAVMSNDPDQVDEGLLFFNGQAPLLLFSATGLDQATLNMNDGLNVDYEFTLTPQQSDALVVGENVLRFEWRQTAGFFVQRIIITVEKEAP